MHYLKICCAFSNFLINLNLRSKRILEILLTIILMKQNEKNAEAAKIMSGKNQLKLVKFFKTLSIDQFLSKILQIFSTFLSQIIVNTDRIRAYFKIFLLHIDNFFKFCRFQLFFNRIFLFIRYVRFSSIFVTLTNFGRRIWTIYNSSK